ncbi:MAG TPA: biotin-dependent carboxyltransferase family protein [Hyphomicrobiaceae bacterium]|nr:biotin-dependent carboxyltransferase family protein [Hyphomicrobiaceae bacterium]
MTELVVASAGPLTALQDAGRFGWQRYGVGPSGAMDRLALALANVLAGNPPGAVAIELALAGARLVVEGGAARVALAGATATLKIDGRPAPPLTSVTVQPGQTVEVGAAAEGIYTYLAVAGSFALAPTLGSLSLHHRTAIGGIDGRPLRAGDRLPLNLAEPNGPDLMLSTVPKPDRGPIRVVLGPQDDYFSQTGLETFLSSTYTISEQADRMGMRLSGPKIEHGPKGYNIVSDGIPSGAIQVPGNGQPLILLADRQTTGGYPKIATVISWDLPRLAQSRPGTALRFQRVDRAEAVRIARATDEAFRTLIASIRPAGLSGLASGDLLSLNLVDGVVDAKE